jgi:hypothetical protein
MPDDGSSMVTYFVGGDARRATVKYSMRNGMSRTEDVNPPWSTTECLPAGELAAIAAKSNDEAALEIAVAIAARGLNKWKWESARKPAAAGWTGTSLLLEWYSGNETVPPPEYRLGR